MPKEQRRSASRSPSPARPSRPKSLGVRRDIGDRDERRSWRPSSTAVSPAGGGGRRSRRRSHSPVPRRNHSRATSRGAERRKRSHSRKRSRSPMPRRRSRGRSRSQGRDRACSKAGLFGIDHSGERVSGDRAADRAKSPPQHCRSKGRPKDHAPPSESGSQRGSSPADQRRTHQLPGPRPERPALGASSQQGASGRRAEEQPAGSAGQKEERRARCSASISRHCVEGSKPDELAEAAAAAAAEVNQEAPVAAPAPPQATASTAGTLVPLDAGLLPALLDLTCPAGEQPELQSRISFSECQNDIQLPHQ